MHKWFHAQLAKKTQNGLQVLLMLKTCVIISSIFFTEYKYCCYDIVHYVLHKEFNVHLLFLAENLKFCWSEKLNLLDSIRFSTNNDWFLKFSFQTEYKYCYDLVLHYVLHYLNKNLLKIKLEKFVKLTSYTDLCLHQFDNFSYLFRPNTSTATI